MRTIISRFLSDSFQCTFFSSSPSCHERTSEGEALSSAARLRNSGPWSMVLSAIGSTSQARGSTSSFTGFTPGRRLRHTSPNTSSTLMRVTPASYTPRCGQAITCRNVRRVNGGHDTFTSCVGA